VFACSMSYGAVSGGWGTMARMTKQLSPSVRRRIIASELKRLRAESGLTREAVEQAVELRRNALYRYESGESAMQVPVARAIFGFYGVEDEQLKTMVDLVRGSRERGWLKKGQEHGGSVPPWFADFVALERDASEIYELALNIVPGRLQTEGYARAVLQAGVLGANVEEQLSARMARTSRVDAPHAPRYWAIVAEGVLHRVVGGEAVMLDQLQYLLEVSTRPDVTLQILPNGNGAHPSMGSSFVMFRFEVAPQFGVVYTEYLTGSLYRDEPTELGAYDSAYRHLIKSALPEVQSVSLIAKTLKERYE
jgi:transcriptional regulator with XRE-family HTH domain